MTLEIASVTGILVAEAQTSIITRWSMLLSISIISGIFSVANGLNCRKVHNIVVRKFKRWCQEMTGETGMSLAVTGKEMAFDHTVKVVVRLRCSTPKLWVPGPRLICPKTKSRTPQPIGWKNCSAVVKVMSSKTLSTAFVFIYWKKSNQKIKTLKNESRDVLRPKHKSGEPQQCMTTNGQRSAVWFFSLCYKVASECRSCCMRPVLG